VVNGDDCVEKVMQVIKGLISRTIFIFHLSKYPYSNKSRDGGINFFIFVPCIFK